MIKQLTILAFFASLQLWPVAVFGQTAAPKSTDPTDKRIEVYELEHADATEMVAVLDELFERSLPLEADPRQNRVLASGTEEELAVVEAVLLRLDDASALQNKGSDDKPNANERIQQQRLLIEIELQEMQSRYGPRHPRVIQARNQLELIEKYFSQDNEREATATLNTDDDLSNVDVVELQYRYERAERAAAKAADEYRSTTQTPNTNETQSKERLAELKAAVESHVAEAFRLRRALQLARIEQSRAELANVERRLTQRDAIKDRIIERRVEDLLFRSELAWLERTNPSVSPGEATNSGSPIGLAGPPHIPLGNPSGPSQSSPHMPGAGVPGQVPAMTTHGLIPQQLTLKAREDALIGSWQVVRIWDGKRLEQSTQDDQQFFQIARNQDSNRLEMIGLRGKQGGLLLDPDNVQRITIQPYGNSEAAAGLYEQSGDFLRIALPQNRQPQSLEPAEGVSLAYLVRTSAEVAVSHQPATNPLDAVVTLELIIDEAAAEKALKDSLSEVDEADDDPVREPQAMYVSGTYVSHDGLIATFIGPELTFDAIAAGLQRATATSPRSSHPPAACELVAYDAETGALLLRNKADSNGRFVPPADIAVGLSQNLTLFGHVESAELEITKHVIVARTRHGSGDDTSLQFLITDSVAPELIGAPLMSRSGELVGILAHPMERHALHDSPENELVERVDVTVAVSSRVYRRMIEDYRNSPATADGAVGARMETDTAATVADGSVPADEGHSAIASPVDDPVTKEDIVEHWTRQIRGIGSESAAERESALQDIRAAIKSGPEVARFAALRVLAATADVSFDKTQFRPLILEVISNGPSEFLQPAFYALAGTDRRPEDLELLKAKLAEADDLHFLSWQSHLLLTFSDGKLDDHSEELILKQLDSDDSSVRREALRGLWGAAVSDRIIERVLELADNPESHHDAIYFGLSTWPHKNAAVVDKLIETLSDPDWNNWSRAVWGLGYGVIESEQQKVASAMIEFHNSRSDPKYRDRAARIVRDYGGEEMLQQLNSESDAVDTVRPSRSGR